MSLEFLESRQLLASDLVAVPSGLSDVELVRVDSPPTPPSQFQIEWNGRKVHAVPGEFVFQKNSRTAPAVPANWSVRSLGTGSWLLESPGATEQQVVSWATSIGAKNLEPNYLLRPLGNPVDPEFPNQWHLPRINAPTAWDTTNGNGQQVIVAVIDSGIDYDHPDFSTPGTMDRRNIWQNPGESGGNVGVNDDNNSMPGWVFTDDLYGWDFGDRDNDPRDNDPARTDREDANIAELGTTRYTGHGTAVAGVIGAYANTTEPQQMVAGVNWDVRLMALKITRTGVGYVLDAAVAAYQYIRMMKSEFNTPIIVANCSWGTYDDNVAVRNLEEQIILAGGQDVLTVAAAGDSGVSIDTTPFYPAAFQSDYVLSVAATNRDDTLWTGLPPWGWADNSSNFGIRNVDVAAPGREILTTTARFAPGGSAPGNTSNWEGTSMAAGIVSGVAALMKAASPAAQALSLKQTIINTVDKVSTLNGLILSGGIVDAAAAVAEIQRPQTPQIDIRHAPGQESGIREGDAGFRSAIWQIRVRGPLNLDPRILYVDYRTLDNDGSATPDGRRDPRVLPDQDKLPDYVPVIGTMAFAPGPPILDRLTQVGRAAVDVGRIRSIPVRVFGDRNVEPSETMRLRIDRAYYKNEDGSIQLVNNYILTRTNDFTIINDDIAAPDGSNPDARTPQITFVGNTIGGGGGGSSSTVQVPEGDSGTSFARFRVRLTIPTTNTVTVRYRTRDVEARAGLDYVARTGTVTFRPNVVEQFIDIPVIGNRIGQSNRSFLVELFDPRNGSLPGTGAATSGNTATGVIVDDDPVISVAGTDPLSGLATATVSEPAGGGSSTTTLQISLRLSQPVQNQVSVRYSTRDLSARAGVDYVAASGTVIFAPGASVATIPITVLADSFLEGDEFFFVDLSEPANAALATASVRCTITNSVAVPGGPPTNGDVVVSTTTLPVTEGNVGQASAIFTLRLAAASVNPVTVTFATANGTALAGRDYVARSGAVRFAPGETVKTVAVPVIANTRIDGNRTFDLVLTLGTGPAARPLGRTTATILDDDRLVAAMQAGAALGPTVSTGAPSSRTRPPVAVGPGTSIGGAGGTSVS